MPSRRPVDRQPGLKAAPDLHPRVLQEVMGHPGRVPEAAIRQHGPFPMEAGRNVRNKMIFFSVELLLQSAMMRLMI